MNQKQLKKILLASTILIFFLSDVMALSDFEDVKDVTQENRKDKDNKAWEVVKVQESDTITIKIVSNKKDFSYPEPITIQVFLYEQQPISDAAVSGLVTSPSGRVFKISFSENVLIGWTLPGSGSYAGIITDLQEDGQYKIMIQANDNSGKAHFARQFGEDFPASQSITDSNEPPVFVKHFEIESIISINAFGYESKSGLPPTKINSLYATIDSDHCVHLFWQVPINIGQDGTYEIRYSSQSITSEIAWSEAKTLYEGRYSSKVGETEKYKIGSLGEGTFYFAVKSKNNKGLQSDISNDYIVSIGLSEK